MINNRLKDLKQLLRKLDITKTMHRNAETKYLAIAKYFQENGLDCDIYPQGSFALGTVVRSFKNGTDGDYDLDFICLIKVNKEETTPEDVKKKVGDLLNSHKVYSKNLTEYDKCWTLKFVGEFNIDIIPAAADSIIELAYDFISNSIIAITDKNKEDYKWLLSNPKGYVEWFTYINKPFLEYRPIQKSNEFSAICEGKVDDLPDYDKKSSLQMVIQILKRHRDIYFHQIREENRKPISAILTTISAQIAQGVSPAFNVFQLLDHIASEFEIYSMRNTLTIEDFDMRYKNKQVIKKSKDDWEILNPVNPSDNLADQWNEDPEKAKLFFQWSKAMKRDLVNREDKDNEEFISGIERGFGTTFVRESLDVTKYRPLPLKQPEVQKPWKNNGR